MDDGLKRDALGWCMSTLDMPNGRVELRSRIGGALEAVSSAAAKAEREACAKELEAFQLHGRDTFNEGFAVACIMLANDHMEGDLAAMLLKGAGITPELLKRAHLDEGDVSAIRDILKSN